MVHSRRRDRTPHRGELFDRPPDGTGEMGRIGSGGGLLNDVTVADFADPDHARRLTRGVLQRVDVVQRIQTDLALIEHGLLVQMQVFDRLLDREYANGDYAR